MPIRIGFCGAGPWAQPYLEALARRPDVTLVGVADADVRAAEMVAAGWGARVFADPLALIDEGQPEALWIGPNPALASVCRARAVERKIPFLASPPGIGDGGEGWNCGRQIARGRLVTAVGFLARYADVVREAREYLGTNPVPLAVGWWLVPVGESTLASDDPWLAAAPLVDALRIFCGEVTRVRGLATRADAGPPGMSLHLEFATGTIGVVTSAALARPSPRRRLELLGDGWALRFAADWTSLRLQERDKTTTLRSLADPAAELTAQFLAAVAAGTPAVIAADWADAFQTFCVCEAARRSAALGRAVTPAETLASFTPEEK